MAVKYSVEISYTLDKELKISQLEVFGTVKCLI